MTFSLKPSVSPLQKCPSPRHFPRVIPLKHSIPRAVPRYPESRPTKTLICHLVIRPFYRRFSTRHRIKCFSLRVHPASRIPCPVSRIPYPAKSVICLLVIPNVPRIKTLAISLSFEPRFSTRHPVKCFASRVFSLSLSFYRRFSTRHPVICFVPRAFPNPVNLPRNQCDLPAS